MPETLRWQLKRAPAGAPWRWGAFCPKESRQRFFDNYPELAGFVASYGIGTAEINEKLAPIRDAEGAASVDMDLPRVKPPRPPTTQA